MELESRSDAKVADLSLPKQLSEAATKLELQNMKILRPPAGGGLQHLLICSFGLLMAPSRYLAKPDHDNLMFLCSTAAIVPLMEFLTRWPQAEIHETGIRISFTNRFTTLQFRWNEVQEIRRQGDGQGFLFKTPTKEEIIPGFARTAVMVQAFRMLGPRVFDGDGPRWKPTDRLIPERKVRLMDFRPGVRGYLILGLYLFYAWAALRIAAMGGDPLWTPLNLGLVAVGLWSAIRYGRGELMRFHLQSCTIDNEGLTVQLGHRVNRIRWKDVKFGWSVGGNPYIGSPGNTNVLLIGDDTVVELHATGLLYEDIALKVCVHAPPEAVLYGFEPKGGV